MPAEIIFNSVSRNLSHNLLFTLPCDFEINNSYNISYSSYFFDFLISRSSRSYPSSRSCPSSRSYPSSRSCPSSRSSRSSHSCPSSRSYCLLLSTHSLDPYLWGESDHPAFGPTASLSLHLPNSSIKSRGDSVVGMWVQLKRHSGDGCDLPSTLCKYDLRKVDLFALSWARV